MLNRTSGRNAGLGIVMLVFGVVLGTLTVGGCRKERVVDVRTPIGDVQVDKDKLDGDVEVKVDTK